jgi:hypothetical protein
MIGWQQRLAITENIKHKVTIGFTITIAIFVGFLTASDLLIPFLMIGFLVLSPILLTVWLSRSVWRIAAFILFIGAFQGVLGLYFTLLPNILTAYGLSVFFIFHEFNPSANRSKLGQSLIFLTLCITVIAMVIPAVIPFRDNFELMWLIDAGQKVALFLILFIFVKAISSEQDIIGLMTVYIISMVLFVTLSVLDFYFGFSFLPLSINESTSAGLDWSQIDSDRIGLYRLRGFAGSMSINRLALWTSVAVMMSVFLSSYSKNIATRFVFLILGGGLIIAVLATGSRSGILGMVFGLMILIVIQFSIGRVAKFAIFGVALFTIFNLFAPPTYLNDFLLNRFLGGQFEAGANNRSLAWYVSWELFLNHPIFGSGPFGMIHRFKELGIFLSNPDAADPHNVWLELLSHRGLIATAPFVVAYILSLVNLLKATWFNGRKEPYAVFVAVFASMSVSLFFNSYAFERIIWFVFAVAIVAESRNLDLSYKSYSLNTLEAIRNSKPNTIRHR